MKILPAFPPADRLHSALAERDIGKLADCWHEQISYQAPGAHARGRHERLEVEQIMLDAFPDAVVEIHERWLSGDTMIETGCLRGTHTGVLRAPGAELPPSGAQIASEYVGIFRFADDRVIEQRMYFDRLELIGQLSNREVGS